MNKKTAAEKIKLAVLCIIGFIYIAPLYISFTISFKNPEEFAKTGLKLPDTFHLTNYTDAIKASNMILAFKNSAIASLLSAILLIIVCSMSAYIITRNSRRKLYNSIYFMFLGALVLPFQVVMLPLYTGMKTLSLMNIPGYILASVGFQIAYNTFIFSGFIKTVPIELEEAACIDGAGLSRTYWQVVFPLLKPIVMTALVLDILSVWNDFALALIVLQKGSQRTLPLSQFMFVSAHNTDLGKAFSAFIISMIPVIILYIFLQKHIINGITAGAIKG
jgi:raffinose/stachyose/melibiose transport system permease protein